MTILIDFLHSRLQVHEKPVASIRRSPRKSPCKQLIKEPVDVKSGEDRNILSQDWDDDVAESMDISCSIQDILNNLSKEESTEKDTPIHEVKENENVATNKLFPLFCKNLGQASQPT